MLKRIFFISTAIIFTILAFSSCNKVEDNIYRGWLRENMTAEDAYEVIWEFKSEGTLVRLYNAGEATDTAYFSIEKKALYTEIKIMESKTLSNLGDANGFYRVEEISDKKLVLTREMMIDESTEGAYLRREFTSLD